MGCWTPTFGVVDTDWSSRTFPNNVAWDYAWYVVNNSGAHTGAPASSSALDVAAGTLSMQFSAPTLDAFTHALGYSYSEDPDFMYCAEDMEAYYSVNWWLPSCDLSGGSSGGPWAQPLTNGNGPVISVNSWGFTNTPGMAGPKLSGSSAQCVFGVATSTGLNSLPTTDGDEGIATPCP
jgi:hypothetical protein